MDFYFNYLMKYIKTKEFPRRENNKITMKHAQFAFPKLFPLVFL